MGTDEATAEELGRRAARNAIANGVPRWAVLADDAPGHDAIDPGSGLPIVSLSGDQLQVSDFIRGHNAEISGAIERGEVQIDFRPFLRSDAQVLAMFEGEAPFRLAPKRPVIIDRHRVRYEVFVPRPPRAPPRFRAPRGPQVRRADDTGKRWVADYEGSPIPVAIDMDHATVAFHFESHITVFHAETGALLQTVSVAK